MPLVWLLSYLSFSQVISLRQAEHHDIQRLHGFKQVQKVWKTSLVTLHTLVTRELGFRKSLSIVSLMHREGNGAPHTSGSRSPGSRA